MLSYFELYGKIWVHENHYSLIFYVVKVTKADIKMNVLTLGDRKKRFLKTCFLEILFFFYYRYYTGKLALVL